MDGYVPYTMSQRSKEIEVFFSAFMFPKYENIVTEWNLSTGIWNIFIHNLYSEY